MKYKIEGGEKDSNTAKYSDSLKVSLTDDDKFQARARSVVSYGGDIQTQTKTTRSLWKAVTSYENFPITEVQTKNGGSGVITVKPPYPSEITAIKSENKKMIVQSLGFLGTPKYYTVDLDKSGVYSNDSIASIEVDNVDESGLSAYFVSGYHGIEKMELSDGQRTHIREDYVLAIDETISYSQRTDSGIKDKALGTGSVPILDLTGPGRVYMHSRSPFEVERFSSKVEKYN